MGPLPKTNSTFYNVQGIPRPPFLCKGTKIMTKSFPTRSMLLIMTKINDVTGFIYLFIYSNSGNTEVIRAVCCHCFITDTFK